MTRSRHFKFTENRRIEVYTYNSQHNIPTYRILNYTHLTQYATFIWGIEKEKRLMNQNVFVCYMGKNFN